MSFNFKAPLVFLFLLFFGFSGFSQNRFENGYYLDKDRNKIPVEIEQKSWTTWSNSSLKIKENGEIRNIPMEDLQGFGIDGKIKFIREEVEIERSSDFLKDMDRDPKPVFQKEEVLLKVIVEGDYSLYLFLDGQAKKFFYRINDGEITQLVRKQYIEGHPPEEIIMVNSLYKKQLEDIAVCSTEGENIRYELYELKRFFINQNECNNSAVDYALKREWRSKLGMNAGAGLVYNSAQVTRSFSSFDLQGISPAIMLELEYKIPTIHHEFNINLTGYFNKMDFSDEVEFTYSLEPREVTFTHSEVFVGIGGDYTYFLNNKSALVMGAGYYFPFILEDTRYTETVSRLDLQDNRSSPFPGIFLGYNYNSFLFKAEVFFPRKLMESTNSFEVNMSRLALSLAYRIF
jgi:hypothetical protein